MIRIAFRVCLFLLLCSASAIGQPQRNATNVLYSYKPLPVFAGVEIGSGLTSWQNATPTYFTTAYPYSAEPDTLNVRFPSGATPMFGFFMGVSGDFSLSKNWGLIGKLNYNERRGNWKSTSTAECDMSGTVSNVPVISELTLLVRCASAELYGRYTFSSLHDFYLGAGIAYTQILNSHYDLTQQIDGPPECAFRDFSTGQGTGIRQYSIGGNNDGLQGAFGEIKVLAGLPLHIGYRWIISPEVTLGLPFTGMFTSAKESEFHSNGVSSSIRPLTITGLLAFRYQLQ